MGLIRYSCGHISGHHEPIHVKFGVWGIFIMFYWNMLMKMLKCKKKEIWWRHISVLYMMSNQEDNQMHSWHVCRWCVKYWNCSKLWYYLVISAATFQILYNKGDKMNIVMVFVSDLLVLSFKKVLECHLKLIKSHVTHSSRIPFFPSEVWKVLLLRFA